jgi:hypothetical protein
MEFEDESIRHGVGHFDKPEEACAPLPGLLVVQKLASVKAIGKKMRRTFSARVPPRPKFDPTFFVGPILFFPKAPAS